MLARFYAESTARAAKQKADRFFPWKNSTRKLSPRFPILILRFSVAFCVGRILSFIEVEAIATAGSQGILKQCPVTYTRVKRWREQNLSPHVRGGCIIKPTSLPLQYNDWHGLSLNTTLTLIQVSFFPLFCGNRYTLNHLSMDVLNCGTMGIFGLYSGWFVCRRVFVRSFPCSSGCVAPLYLLII